MPDRLHFRRHWFRFAIPCAFAAAAFGQFAYRIPDGVWVAVPAFGLTVSFAALLHGGLVLTREGIEWYVIVPSWQYRFAPWSAVRDVRKGWLGTPRRIRLVAEPGRYEPWVWGTPRPDRPADVVIFPKSYSRGDELWDAIRHYWPPPDRNPAGAAPGGSAA